MTPELVELLEATMVEAAIRNENRDRMVSLVMLGIFWDTIEYMRTEKNIASIRVLVGVLAKDPPDPDLEPASRELVDDLREGVETLDHDHRLRLLDIVLRVKNDLEPILI